jgi:hypothetical protein
VGDGAFDGGIMQRGDLFTDEAEKDTVRRQPAGGPKHGKKDQQEVHQVPKRRRREQTGQL